MTAPDTDRRAARRAERARRLRRRRRVALGLVVGLPVAAATGVVAARLLTSGDGRALPTKSAAAGSTSSTSAVSTPATTTSAPGGHGALELPDRPLERTLSLPVLMYHRVAPASTATNAVSRDLTVTPAAFRAQMAWLAARGYRPITQERLVRALYEGRPLPRRPVVLTFDDGYVDAVRTVLPTLARRRWPATFYVITGRVGTPAFLTWPQLRRLDRAGMDIGSHTVDHRELPALDEAGRSAQLTTSRRDLERHLGHPVYWFCYPAGRVDPASAASVGRAGYLLAVTTRPGTRIATSGALETPRVRVRGPGTVDQLRQALSGT